jgi:exo-beta-1,3-glucanase (GH17 family)
MTALAFPASLRRFTVLSVFAAALVYNGCGFDDPPPQSGASNGTAGDGSTTGSAGSSEGAGGAPGSGGDAIGGTGGAASGTSGATSGTGGATGTGGQGGSVSSEGGAGMGVAGGPPAFSSKAMSVVAYSPYRDGQAPGGAQPSRDQVKQDLQLLKPLIDGVRIYGTDGANAYVPALCDELGIELHIGAWIDGLPSDEPNTHALAKIVNENHPSIKTAIVGNEVLARSTKNNVTEARLIELINIAKAEITVKTVKIAAADTYPQWMMMRPNLAAAVDLLIWHTYAWFAGEDIAKAYPLISKRYDDMLAAYPGKPMLLGETGWPSQVDHMSMDMTTTAVGSEVNQARFYREALAGMRARNLRMWMFSAIDEKWKATTGEGEVGAHWGFYDSARKPKAAATEMLMMK